VISGRSGAADKQKDRPVSASLDGPEYTVKAHFVPLFIVYHICSKSQAKLVGHCPRQAIFDTARYHPDHPLHVDPTHPFDDYVMEIMEAGNVWEHQTVKALASKLNGRVHWKRDDPALRVGNDVWSGHIDFLIDPCQELPDGAIIEHKARNPVNFVRKGKMEYTLPGDVRRRQAAPPGGLSRGPQIPGLPAAQVRPAAYGTWMREM
jgi:hypothetical protein